MAKNTRLGDAVQNAAIDAALAIIGASGRLRLYTGTQPTEPDTALGSQTLLVDLPLNATAFASASGASAAMNTVSAVTNTAVAAGSATWGSFTTSAGVRKIDISVGTSAANLVMNSVAITNGATVTISGYTFTLPLQGN